MSSAKANGKRSRGADGPVDPPSSKQQRSPSTTKKEDRVMQALHIPQALGTPDAYEAYFNDMVPSLMRSMHMMIAGQAHRILELEMYYTGPGHEDMFTHQDDVQLQCGQWYFHRSGTAYRGGTYKGVDIACGNGVAHGGLLVRTLQRVSDGKVVCGPCMVVNHVLSLTNTGTIPAFVAAHGIDVRPGRNTGMYLAPVSDPEPVGADAVRQGAADAWGGDVGDGGASPSPSVASWLRGGAGGGTSPGRTPGGGGGGGVCVCAPRVGLSLKAKRWSNDRASRADAFIMRPYRYVLQPHLVKKHRHLLALGLYRSGGYTVPKLCAVLGTGASSVQRWIDAYAAGRKLASAKPFFGVPLKVDSTCRLFGVICAQQDARQQQPQCDSSDDADERHDEHE